jgi:hypothetical protein
MRIVSLSFPYACLVNNGLTAWIWPAFVLITIAVTVVIHSRNRSTLRAQLAPLLTSLGWESVKAGGWILKVQGRWRGLDVELRYMGRQKRIPERLLLTVKAAAPARIILTRRTNAFLSKPMTFFGLPLIESMNFADHDQYWIRSDEPMLAERLLSNAAVANALESNLVAQFDAIDLRPARLLLQRAVDDRAVEKRFGRPMFRFGLDLELIETIVTEEWALAKAIIDALGLRGAA